MIAPDQLLPMQTTAHLKTSTWSCSVYRACIQDCSSSVISKATKDCTSFARIATIEEVSLIFQKNLQNTIFPGIFALTVAAARGLVLKAFRQILERTPYDEEIQIKQRSRRVLLQSVKWFTLFGVRRKVPKSAILFRPVPLVCAENNPSSEHIFFKIKDRRLRILGTGHAWVTHLCADEAHCARHAIFSSKKLQWTVGPLLK